MVEAKQSSGIVYLIGAGPGDPRLLTLRGFELLQRAEVILYDYLVNPVIVAYASGNAELHCLGQHGRTRIWSQAEINQRLVQEAAAGRIVVRLKGGDPNVFGRLAEEVAALRNAGIDYEIVPGISAAFAASAFAGVPLTSRTCASGVAFVTGHELDQPGKEPLDFGALARFPGTLVVYMGVTTASTWVSELLRHGMSPQTPAALVRRCSLSDQQVIRCALSEVPERLTPYAKFPPPVIAIIGEVAAESADVQVDRRHRQPLFGSTVLVTRPLGQADAMSEQLAALGAIVLNQPVIQIRPVDDPVNLARIVTSLNQYDWIVFVSGNGVRFFLAALLEHQRDGRCLHGIKLAAVGPATAEELARFGLLVDLVPEIHRAEALGEALVDRVAGARVLLIRASRGRDVLLQRLASSADSVDQLAAYASVDVTEVDPRVRNLMDAGQIDWVVAMSSASARSLVRLFGDALHTTRIASLSPLTSAALRECGMEPAVEASEYTGAGLIQALCDACRNR